MKNITMEIPKRSEDQEVNTEEKKQKNIQIIIGKEILRLWKGKLTKT